ncbi:MAG: SDR family NAD(P)-dependent oxidoreductase, partial [Betaproteobacteria bacterium]|nr:SDR family NAD(P)-dependent oxidoreductase [Betaproteobacteria bacterium]
SNLRGRLMAGHNSSGDRGAMLAVQADEAAVLGFLREDDGQLVVANRNSPTQYVLSGPLEQIKRAFANLTKRAIRSRMLQVSAAFHSPLVADARAPFAEALEGIAFDHGRMPVYANATGREYPGSAKQAREVLANQIVRPVNFMEQVLAMHADGVQTFIEVGPGHVLSDLVQSILPGREVETIALDASKGKRSGIFDLALALARLASLGHDVKLAKWENAPLPVEVNASKPALAFPLSGANYRAPTTPRPPVAPRPTSVEMPAVLRATQDGILALQRLQEQTAQLHKQFLEGQESARRSIQSLLEMRSGNAIPRLLAAPAPLAAQAQVQVQVQVPAQVPISLAAATPIPPAPAPGRAEFEHAVLEVVCEKTGYPVEMLNLGMGMDADLGIDSIKRVEIMAGLRTRLPAAPEIKPEHLGSLQTLEQVVAFLASGAPATAASAASDADVSHHDAGVIKHDAGVIHHGAGAINISETLLTVVAEKTGYPIEMLNLGMGMDADLGIDSIKRVEIMAALRGKLPDSPEIKPEDLGTLRTLQQIVDFLAGQPAEPVLVAAASAAPREQTAAPEPSHPEVLPAVLRQIVRPVALSRDDRRDTLSLPVGAQVWLTDDGSELCMRLEERLRARRLMVHRGDLRQGFSGSRADTLAALVILSPAGGSHAAFLQQAFRLIQRAGPALRKAGGEGAAILTTVSRLDGAFGFGDLNSKGDPVSGGLAGLVKTARHEWPQVHCKALDLDPESTDADAAAEQIVTEMFRVGPVEVGLSGNGRVALEVSVATIERFGAEPPLSEGEVLVVSGGARGITGDAALALARAWRPKLVLLGRSELGDSEPAWLQDLQTEAGIKQALFDRKKGGGSPKVVAAECREVLARREIRAQLGRLEAAGAQTYYHSVDVRDNAALARILTEVRQRHGAIRGLVHGAGVLADRRIEDKTEEQFDLVYGTKVTGLRNLLTALAQEELKVIALFSSYSGRFGRVGQADYAAANEVLNKLAQMESRRRPDCRVVSVNWGPWNGGMATPGVRKLFAQEGIGLIEPAAGAEFLLQELCSAEKGVVEVLALAPSPGIGTIPARLESPVPVDSLAFVREVSVEALPCLESHVFNGRAVLPAALMVEWLAQAALHSNPGMTFHGLDHFKVLKGIVLQARQSVTVSLRTAATTLRDNLHVVPVRMTSQTGGRELLHAQADVLLTTEHLPNAPEPTVVNIPGGGFADAYALGVLFHGAALHGIERVEGLAERGVAAILKAASAPIKWMTHPLRGTWIADPLALDSAFQMMILWSSAHRGAPSLPSALGRYRQFVPVFPKGGCRAVIAVALGISAIAVATIQFFDRQGNLLASAEDCEFVMDATLRDAFRLNRLGLEK